MASDCQGVYTHTYIYIYIYIYKGNHNNVSQKKMFIMERQLNYGVSIKWNNMHHLKSRDK